MRPPQAQVLIDLATKPLPSYLLPFLLRLFSHPPSPRDLPMTAFNGG
jgi:hypothetical protein